MSELKRLALKRLPKHNPLKSLPKHNPLKRLPKHNPLKSLPKHKLVYPNYKVETFDPASIKVLNGLFNTNDLKGCAMFGADTWNALKNTVAKVADDALNGRVYIVPTVISCPENMAAELLGFNDIYAHNLGENFYTKTWPVIKSNSAALLGANALEWVQDNIFDSKVGNIVKQGTHIASNVLAKTPIGGWVNIGRDTNNWMSNIWDSLVGKKKSEEETPTAVKAGGGLLIVAGLGVGAYFLLRDDKKKKRGR